MVNSLSNGADFVLENVLENSFNLLGDSDSLKVLRQVFKGVSVKDDEKLSFVGSDKLRFVLVKLQNGNDNGGRSK